jgi:hypothetical protein
MKPAQAAPAPAWDGHGGQRGPEAVPQGGAAPARGGNGPAPPPAGGSAPVEAPLAGHVFHGPVHRDDAALPPCAPHSAAPGRGGDPRAAALVAPDRDVPAAGGPAGEQPPVPAAAAPGEAAASRLSGSPRGRRGASRRQDPLHCGDRRAPSGRAVPPPRPHGAAACDAAPHRAWAHPASAARACAPGALPDPRAAAARAPFPAAARGAVPG